MYPRSEFPVEKIPSLIDAAGRVNKRAVKMRFSACGKPHADPSVFAALIKAGHNQNTAFQLAILASDLNGRGTGSPDVDCVDEGCSRIKKLARDLACELHPYSKWAEERAALLERRESRWGTKDFHSSSADQVRTKHYPFNNAEKS